jgi:hypothetical protein
LPDSILNEVTSMVAAWSLEDQTVVARQASDTRAKIREIQRATGRAIIFVYRSGEFDINGNLVRRFWTAVFVDEPSGINVELANDDPTIAQKATPEEALAYAEDVVARTIYDANYDIVVVR